MSLINLNIEPSLVERIARALESIAATLNQYCFPRKLVADFKPRGVECLTEFDPEVEAMREEEEERRQSLGLPPR